MEGIDPMIIGTGGALAVGVASGIMMLSAWPKMSLMLEGKEFKTKFVDVSCAHM